MTPKANDAVPTTPVLDSTMHYIDAGEGPAFVFLHGNPTSSYLWRKVLAALDLPVRRLAPDLIGMGASGKPPISYDFDDHARYLAAWLGYLDLGHVVLVGHDWGGALALDWAASHPDQVAGVALLETILRPMSWNDFPESARPVFQSLREAGTGERLVLEENLFIEQALPGTIPDLSPADLAAYAAPYPTPETRLPLLQWPRQMPLDGEPARVVEIVENYGRWLAKSTDVPKLLVAFDPGPGIMVTPDVVAWSRDNVAELTVAQYGAAAHHAPEDRGEDIARALQDWALNHGLTTTMEH
jgi:haloalkane dehalogenase